MNAQAQPAAGVAWGFERGSVSVSVDALVAMKPLRPDVKMSAKYRQIVTSIKAVGLVEPPVVIPASDQPGVYYVLDGHLRLEALRDLGVTTVDCLISRDDEAFTYNKRINRLSAPQEHRMIARAIERGVSEVRLSLRGILFDADGAPMSPSFTRGRNGQVYRYYVSSPLQLGRPVRESANAIRRVSAAEVERVLRDHLTAPLGASEDAGLEILLGSVKRVEIEADAVRVTLPRAKVVRAALSQCDPAPEDPASVVLTVPIRCRLRGGRNWILPPDGLEVRRGSKRNPVLIRGLRHAHQLAAEMGWRCSDGSVDLQSGRAPDSAYMRKLCRLAFLAPDIQRLILEGRQPPGANLEMLVNVAMPTSWAEQRQRLGLLQK